MSDTDVQLGCALCWSANLLSIAINDHVHHEGGSTPYDYESRLATLEKTGYGAVVHMVPERSFSQRLSEQYGWRSPVV